MRRILALGAVALLLVAGAVVANPNLLVPVFANPTPTHAHTWQITSTPVSGVQTTGDAVGEVVTLAATLGNTQVLQGSNGELLLELTVTGQEREKVLNGDRLPMNIAIVVDRSGSMSADNKIGYARQAAEFLVDQLLPSDRVSLVAYSDGAATLMAPQLVGDGSEVRQAISRLSSGGGTNLHDGMQVGARLVERHLASQQINRVILISDGMANQGISDTPTLSHIAGQWQNKGVAITAMGVGNDFNEDLMVNLAEYSGGNYHYIEAPTQLAGIFERELTELVATVAQTASVSVALADGVTCAAVPGYRFEQSGNTVRIPLGDIPAGQERRIIARLNVPTDELGETPVAQAAISFFNGEDGNEYAYDAPMLTVSRTEDPNAVADNANIVVQEKNERIRAAEAVEEAVALYREGRRDEARQVVADQIGQSRRFNDVAQSPDLEAQLQEMEALGDDMDQAAASSAPLPKSVVKDNKAKAYGHKK